MKVANASPTAGLPGASSDAAALEARLGNILRAMKARYPNLELVFLASRIYAGYADVALNPEPYAYESGFAVKWIIEAQIDQIAGGSVDPLVGDLDWSTVVPWVGWGPYLWADGLTPRSDGLTWVCAEFETDGTHPALDGETKVGTHLLDFFLTSPYTSPWFAPGQAVSVPALQVPAWWGTAALLVVLGGRESARLRRSSTNHLRKAADRQKKAD